MCQYWMGVLWLGEDFVSPGLGRASPVFNPREGDRWLRAAALQGHPRAMHEYGFALCSNTYWRRGDLREHIIEGLAWQFASPIVPPPGTKRDELNSCPTLESELRNNRIDETAVMAAAKKRVPEIENLVEVNSGFRFRWPDPCLPFAWIDSLFAENMPMLDLFKICLNIPDD
jgi:hypothetical protein